MKKSIMAIAVVATLWSCNKAGDSVDYQSAKEVINTSLESDTTASGKIIKTADIRFRVKDARQTKADINAQLKRIGGTLVESSLQSDIQRSEKVKYSADSLLEITSYKTEGRVIAKVPSEKLDEFTDLVAQKAYFVDHQSLKFDDQHISYLGNKAKAQNRIDAIESINKQAVRKSGNVESSLYIKDDYVDKKIQNLRIDEQVKFSEISMSFYQDNTVSRLVVGNDNLSDYHPGFFQRLGLNFVNGWTIFKEILLIAANLWMFLVIAVVIYFGLTYYRRRNSGISHS